jgi:hypothetical protein
MIETSAVKRLIAIGDRVEVELSKSIVAGVVIDIQEGSLTVEWHSVEIHNIEGKWREEMIEKRILCTNDEILNVTRIR